MVSPRLRLTDGLLPRLAATTGLNGERGAASDGLHHACAPTDGFHPRLAVVAGLLYALRHTNGLNRRCGWGTQSVAGTDGFHHALRNPPSTFPPSPHSLFPPFANTALLSYYGKQEGQADADQRQPAFTGGACPWGLAPCGCVVAGLDSLVMRMRMAGMRDMTNTNALTASRPACGVAAWPRPGRRPMASAPALRPSDGLNYALRHPLSTFSFPLPPRAAGGGA